LITIKVTDRDGQLHEVQGHPNDKLMEVLREFDWGVSAICGGMCSCATCHVYVDQPWLDKFPRREMDEEELLEFLDGFRPGSRLSCQLELREIHDGLEVELAPDE
jgi:ferredoxin, 2Fe-2S